MSVVINGTTGITSVNGSAAAPSVTGADTDTGIVYGTNTLSLATGGTTAVTVDSSQNVGIGTSSPTAKLTVSSTSSVVTNGASTRNPVASLYGGNSNNRLDMYVDNSGATAIMGLGAYNVAGGTTAMTFYTGASVAEAMRIDTSGNLLVGTTSGSNRLTVSSAVNDYISRMYNTNATGADMLYMQSTADPNNSTYKFIYTYSGAAARFSVSSNGGISNYSANNVNLSDRREKTNFAPAKSYLDVICAIPVQTYNYIDQNMEEDGGLTLGVVAQDVQAVAPELVTESNWGTDEEPKMRLSIYQTDMQYALMKCIQEQQALITQLQADVAALKAPQ